MNKKAKYVEVQEGLAGWQLCFLVEFPHLGADLCYSRVPNLFETRLGGGLDKQGVCLCVGSGWRGDGKGIENFRF